jgi:hypothetical protein
MLIVLEISLSNSCSVEAAENVKEVLRLSPSPPSILASSRLDMEMGTIVLFFLLELPDLFLLCFELDFV